MFVTGTSSLYTT